MAAVGKPIVVGAVDAELIVDRYATLHNRDAANSVYLGGANVTAAAGANPGYELKAGESIEVDAAIDSVYGICAAGLTARVDILATRRSYAA